MSQNFAVMELKVSLLQFCKDLDYFIYFDIILIKKHFSIEKFYLKFFKHFHILLLY